LYLLLPLLSFYFLFLYLLFFFLAKADGLAGAD
jgi:hypothetical protein